MSPALSAKLDAVFALPWAGSVVRVHERFDWHPEAVPADRPRLRSRLVSFLQMRLEGIGLNMGCGTVEFSLSSAETWVCYGVMIDRLEAIEFPTPDRVYLVEQFGPQVWRRSQVDRNR